ncbi:MAG: sugar ABC transporter permease [Anaerolineales bacterium]|nr:sugar ABC transporter permease [Anaerolineales bacterium]
MQSASIFRSKVLARERISFETRHKDRMGLIFISPWLIGLLLFNLAPILISLILSFTDFHLLTPEQAQFTGISNYTAILRDMDAGKTFWQTIRLGLMVVPLQIIASVFFAGLLNDQRLLMKNTMRTLFFLPSIIPAFSAALMWQGYVNPATGWLNRILLNPLGLGWLNHFSSRGASESLFILSSLWTIGPSILIMLGAMQGIQPEIYEAARMDGAEALTRFFKITLPLITSAVFFILILNLTAVLGGAILLDRGNTFRFTFSSYDSYVNAVLFRLFNLGYASSLAWVFFVFAMTVVLILFVTSKHWVYYPDREA